MRADMKLEVVTLPVSDVDRAREFYQKLGWRLDETPPWVVQLTPPGSWCSVQFGEGLTTGAPGSAQRLYLIVSDLAATRDDLLAAGVNVGEIFHLGENGPVAGPEAGPDPGHNSYSSLATFADPDGNTWLLQEITSRLPGRVDSAGTTFTSTPDLASALRRAAAAHGEHEKRTGEEDINWPDWYADYMVREQSGTQLPT
ncbi:glyoxalase [Streptomyces sp. AcH 505]|uniref:VOC family protein n=1 Tax=Streptomyces sp. AcH 505 TaxID=352211 RepID=UPI0005919118|nr:glyoxalase [Streptomyces sp. AcH 505]